ncbi:MAG TPA: AarF/ABC1/UbiB kinase family protein [Ktedonobacteraceae bacterium]|jgi:predicted unusual protein kinase regulating ubiquinone biosynthesis (AarF/ABC1/UbiB family)|nr:AarF/ABC1/UbiB kinase family protein [Ktedonobacteraceae bacterium]
MRTKKTSINRFSQIVRFVRVSRLLLWTLWVIYRERRRVINARTRGNYEVQPNIEVLITVLVAFRKTAIELGVLMIKLGQFLSARADILPERALAVLSSLQDEVPPEPFEHVVSVIESELGKPVEEVFSSLERKCTAAASLGQVHKAVLLATGETVAVKIQRPHIVQLVNMDLSTLRFVIWVINRFVNTSEFIDLMGIYREFKRTTYEEIDYMTEATNAKRFRTMFEDDPTIYIPRIYDEYTRRHMLVLEWIDGIKINDYAELDAAHINRLEVATRAVNAYFRQFFDEGFFHADPHPGNIFVKKGNDDYGPVIAFVDFGMVGNLSNSMKKSIRSIFLSFLTRDSHSLVQALSQLGFIGEGANMTAIERAVSIMLDQYLGMTLGEMRGIDLPEAGREIENLLYGQPFQLPSQFAFTGRAVGTLVGVSTGLAPDFNFIDVATPYARRFLGLDAENLGKTAQELLSQILESGRTLLTLPSAIENIINRLETGQLEVKLTNFPGASTTRRGRRRASSSAAMVTAIGGGSLSLTAIFIAALGAGVFLLAQPHLLVAGWFCLAMSAVLALSMIVRR